MTGEDSREHVPMYVAMAGARDTERHISLVPHMPGLEAICGQPVRTTRPGPWRVVVTATTCPICRARGIDAARPVLASAPPSCPTSAWPKRRPTATKPPHHVEPWRGPGEH